MSPLPSEKGPFWPVGTTTTTGNGKITWTVPSVPDPPVREQVLDTAMQYVTRDRQAEHGRPEDTFQCIADLWNTYLNNLDTELMAHDVAALMVLLKVARLTGNPGNLDNWIDVAGYAACGGELSRGIEAAEVNPEPETPEAPEATESA